MHFRIIVAGKPALAYAKAGIEEYLKRLTRHGHYELITVKAGSSDEVSARLLEKSQGCHRIALDERGVAMDTRGFSQHLASLEQRGEIKAVALLIGASDGHNDGLRKAADLLLSVSGFTLQHELATVVLLEQLYRVAMLKSGAPYHRD
ncbi:MAG TPA: 23S rRNA (pseudouridine(1915)-N(3))-methyltransferase RlmH [Luteolibacter sp.]|nr:23S rRNA (pseudouridine(1915)-N(3))-methyltransferase RlmH [Luteolibacter sp.]